MHRQSYDYLNWPKLTKEYCHLLQMAVNSRSCSHLNFEVTPNLRKLLSTVSYHNN